MDHRHDNILFWGCFIALITTSYAFVSRIILCTGQFAADFSLDKVAVGELQGAGIWPFGVSIIVFSLFIDRIGCKLAMVVSFVSYLIYAAMAFSAYSCIHGLSGDALGAGQKHGHQLLYWGSIILGLGNGTVESYVNPVVATLFKIDKTKWLNRLHAGWPGGLMLGGLCTIALANNADWRISLGLILIPAFAFFCILIGKTFPKSEREQAGVSYLAMFKEFGVFGAIVGFGLVFEQLGQVFNWSNGLIWALTGAVVLSFVGITKSFGRFILAVFIIIMIPQAIAEVGTDGWITSLMQTPMQAAGHNPAWVLVYTSAIMLVLRFGAGPLIHKLSPLGLLATCSALAAMGLFAFSKSSGSGMFAVFSAATLYGVGKTFLWPTILGLTSEQCPRGGTLTLNAISGIGMLAVGIVGQPFLGYLQESSTTKALGKVNPALYQAVTVENKSLIGRYRSMDPVKRALAMDADSTSAIANATTAGQCSALGEMALFPLFGMACYILLKLYFNSTGGYKPVQLALCLSPPGQTPKR